MTILYAPTDFVSQDCTVSDSSPGYWYEVRCPQSGDLLRLPRTRLAEAIAYGLMQHLATAEGYFHEGKMYGVLLVETPCGQRLLKAFSGLLNGNSIVEGWVPPIPGRDQIAFEETRTLAVLETLKQEIITLQDAPERQQYEALSQEFEMRLQQLALRHN